jgi:hypothetical protein
VPDAQAWALETLGPAQYACLDAIVSHESRWDPGAWNGKGSGAYGLPQAKPGSKMASAGADWQTNPETQLRWMIGYLDKYGGPCGGWAFWLRHGWY